LVYELTSDKNIKVSQVIGYNRYYLNFNRIINNTLREQLHSLNQLLAIITLVMEDDLPVRSWNSNRIFTTHTCYAWLEYGGIFNEPFKITLTAYISLKIKICYG
jgi:hypothetical protein